MQCENEKFNIEILELDNHISKLDDEYKSIRDVVNQTKFDRKEMEVAVTNIQSEMLFLKDKVISKDSKEASTDGHFKCKIREKSFDRGNEMRSHIVSTH